MADDGGRGKARVSWRLVAVAAGLVAFPAVAAVLTFALLTSPAASHGNAKASASSLLTEEAGSAACASTNQTPVNSTRAGAYDSLVPPGATAVLLCRYGRNGKREGTRSVTHRATVYTLGWELNALAKATGAYSCPRSDAESITADFSYASGAPNPVSVGLTGCQPVTNGHVKRLGLEQAVIGQLGRLVPASRKRRRG